MGKPIKRAAWCMSSLDVVMLSWRMLCCLGMPSYSTNDWCARARVKGLMPALGRVAVRCDPVLPSVVFGWRNGPTIR
ncbi:hypothetical protein BCR34DRAFT_317552 [Clohesyomyces aquaticus]|uniref:Secreted protein n=1 Tax=Clohesyomyces aquaticus TaxID=1231657 RepID=A0A1Y1ZP40_9PLEO|nr:hypothetical protein BCR34DRAFT_317552 [Clohesyomyces aquaticus]